MAATGPLFEEPATGPRGAACEGLLSQSCDTKSSVLFISRQAGEGGAVTVHSVTKASLDKEHITNEPRTITKQTF